MIRLLARESKTPQIKGSSFNERARLLANRLCVFGLKSVYS